MTGRLAVQIGKMRAMLRQLEWKQAYIEEHKPFLLSRGCPVCKRKQDQGHTPRYKLAALLNET